jgi:hypothetical protein
MIRNTKKGRTPFKSTRHGKTRRVQRGGAPVNDDEGKQIGEYDETGLGRAVYPGVGLYVGHFLNGVPHGQGKLTYEDESVYEGDWKNDVKSGHGVMRYVSGDVYDGEWANDVENGIGIMKYKNGNEYNGKWLNGERHGGEESTMRYADGSSYKGEWQNDERNGLGKLTYTNGDVYEGAWLNNKRQGQGTYTYPDRRVYEGEWADDERQPGGKMTYPDGSSYEGKWADGERQPGGKFTYPNRDVYDGEWADGQKNGKGHYVFYDGGTYNGQWKHDEMHGHGTRTFKNGDVYDGEWADGQKNGRGTYTFQSGDVYEGNWLNDNMHDANGSYKTHADGKEKVVGNWINNDMHGIGLYEGELNEDGFANGPGKCTFINGGVYKGMWYANCMHGHGEMKYPNGDVYEGLWNSDNRHGEGTMKYADGNVYEGEWQNDVKHGTGIQRYSDGRVYNGLWKDGGEHPLFDPATGKLADNEEYDPYSLPPFSPPIHIIELSYNAEVTDIIAFEKKRISHELKNPKSFFMQIHGAYYVTSIDNIIKQMNDKNNIKYECTKQSPVFVPPVQEEEEEEQEEEEEEEEQENQALNVDDDEEEEEEGEQQPVEPVPAFSIDTDVDKAVPYLAISNLFGMQGLVPVFELWSAIKSGHQAYRFVPIPNGEILLIASHATTYRYGLWMSSDHCQGGAPQQVYTLERLDIRFDPKDVSRFVSANKIQNAIRSRQASKTVRREKEYQKSRREFHDWYVKDNAAHKIQRAWSSSQKLKNPNGGKRNKHLKTARKTRRNKK